MISYDTARERLSPIVRTLLTGRGESNWAAQPSAPSHLRLLCSPLCMYGILQARCTAGNWHQAQRMFWPCTVARKKTHHGLFRVTPPAQAFICGTTLFQQSMHSTHPAGCRFCIAGAAAAAFQKPVALLAVGIQLTTCLFLALQPVHTALGCNWRFGNCYSCGIPPKAYPALWHLFITAPAKIAAHNAIALLAVDVQLDAFLWTALQPVHRVNYRIASLWSFWKQQTYPATRPLYISTHASTAAQ